jgi:hypothetical protein
MLPAAADDNRFQFTIADMPEQSVDADAKQVSGFLVREKAVVSGHVAPSIKEGAA